MAPQSDPGLAPRVANQRSVQAAPQTGHPTRASGAQVLQQFRIILKAVKSHFQQVERSTGVGGSQVWALSVIRATPGIGVGELARALSIRQPTASILARNLAQHGLIETRRLPTDRRAVALHALPAAERLLGAVVGPHSGLLPKALEAMDERTLDRMSADLGRLIKLLEADLRAGGTTLDSL